MQKNIVKRICFVLILSLTNINHLVFSKVINMKNGSTVIRTCLSMICLWFMVACVNQQTKIIDEEHKTFYVNGVSALDGYETVSNSLKNLGFKIDNDGVAECDLTHVGRGFTYYVNYYAEKLTSEQSSRLTCGLFDNLPSGFAFDGNGKWRVYLSWYKSGEINKCLITFEDGFPLSNEDAAEVNKRLSALFPHSKIGNSSYGYKTYYDDNGIEVYFTNSITLEMEKK